MTPQEELTRYFEVCGYSPDDTISVVTRAAADGPLFWSFVTVADAPRRILASKHINVWFSANPMQRPAEKESRGSTADVVAVRALWADLDVKPGGLPDKRTAQQVMKGLASVLGVDPCAIVWSGHGYQPRWKVDIGELHTPEAMAPVMERFGELVKMLCGQHGGQADSVYDMPRIIRAPHTMNIKPDTEPVPTKVWLYPDAGTVSFERLLAVLDEYVPARQPSKRDTAEAEFRHVGLERGDAYVQSAMNYIAAELHDIADWAPGRTDDRGRGWEKIQADAALRLASLAKADWNSYDLSFMERTFCELAPIGGGWTVRDVIKKWKSQVRRAEPAEAPADTDDPLAGGGAPPHSSAAREAADIWGGGDGAAQGVGAADIWGPISEAEESAADRDRPESAEGDGGLPPTAADLNWKKYSWDDFGNADRTVGLYGDTLRYVPAFRRWLRYEEGTWTDTETGGEKAVQDMLRQLYALEGPLYSDVEYPKTRGKMTSERIEFSEWWTQQRAASKVSAAAKVIRNDGLLDAAPSEFDSHPMLLNAPNGVVDLQTGELLEHHPQFMLRRQIPVVYEPEAKAPRWEAFLQQVMPSQDMRDYLQRIVGYTLTGDTGEQVVFFHVGLSGAGKSVFLEVLGALLGDDLASPIPPTTLLNKKQEQHPTDISDMEGRRYLYLDETPEGARLDEALVKRLSGESMIKARGMGENFRSFQMVGKIHLATNHDPHISDDAAVHRRLHYIPWRHVIPETEKNTKLKAQIIAEELEGVLAWGVRGTQRWLTDRLAMPAEALTARAAYIASEDEFRIFMEEELIVGAESFTAFKDVYRRYTQWCDGLRMKPMGSKAFTQKLIGRGVEYKRRNDARGFKVALAGGQWATPDPLG